MTHDVPKGCQGHKPLSGYHWFPTPNGLNTPGIIPISLKTDE